VRTYELVFVAQPELDEDGLKALVESVQQVMIDSGGEIVKIEEMGRRRLAYPIRKHREGHYTLMHAKLERPAIMELERSLKLSEDVLRHLLVRLDESE
jgi:small subunit ribosomal protein S6